MENTAIQKADEIFLKKGFGNKVFFKIKSEMH